MCDAYTSFAEVYDLFMDNVPYDDWSRRIDLLLKEYLPRRSDQAPMVLDLGCGTGQITRRLRDMGYDMTGVDGSDEMLYIARSKESDDSILYICQDMRQLDLFGTYNAVVSVCDCMNYITDIDDLTEVFFRVNNFLDPGGLFVFDINTIYKYENELSDNTFAENREEGSFIWENSYDRAKRMNYYELTLYIRKYKDSYSRFFEEHIQRAYSREEIVSALEKAGLMLIEVLDTDSGLAVRPDSEKITFVAREYMKDPLRPGFYKDGTRQKGLL